MTNIVVKQIEFKSSNGTDTVIGWVYLPGGKTRGAVQIFHGMAEHMGRYHEFMRFLAQNGFAACGIDHVGHGRSAGDQQYGYFAEQDGWRVLIDDQYKFNRIIRSELPGCRPVLLGHSMGSFIARLYAAKYPQKSGGLILLGTGRSNFKVGFAMHSAEQSIKKNGPKFIDRTLNRTVFGKYNDRIVSPRSGFDWLTRDVQSLLQYKDDPACGFVFTVSGFRDLFTLVTRANQQKCFESVPESLPILILSGSMDPVGDYGKGPAQVYDRYLKAGISDVGLVIYEGARHELLNETNKEQVQKEILGWLEDHLDAQEGEPEIPSCIEQQET